jgi:hypothetical protein
MYDAFISYSHEKDRRIATALQSVMQTLGKPWWKRRSLRVFRDETSLTATPELWPTIESALDSARFLVLMASPEAAASEWVNKEVAAWFARCGPDKGPKTLLIVLTGGELEWDHKTNDFNWSRVPTSLPPALRGRWGPTEPLWVDLRDYREVGERATKKNHDFTSRAGKIAAHVLGVPLEDLLSEELRQQRRALGLATLAATCLLALLLATAGFGWLAAAQRNRALASQSHMLAEVATQQAGKSVQDYTTGALIALEALPDDSHSWPRPYVPEAEFALASTAAFLRERHYFKGHADTVVSAAFSEDGTRLVTASDDHTARVWDIRSEKMVAVLRHKSAVRMAIFSPDGGRLLTLSSDNTARIWDAQTGDELGTINRDTHGDACAFSPDGTRV